MAEALLRGWLDTGMFAAESIVASDPSRARRDVLADELNVQVSADNADAIASVDALMVAVKPQVLEAVCAPIAAGVADGTLIISIAAGVTLEKLESIFGAGRPIVRVMPNILHSVQDGVAALCSNDAVTDELMAFALELFRSIGVAEEVEERLMDAVTGLSGSGPAFVFVFLEALSDGAVAAGLPRALATPFAAQTVLGAAKWVLAGKRPGELKELVTSPGGTTIEGLRVAEANGLRIATMEAVLAAARKSAELGKPKEES
jgi:pyrroline-5-carboxylate reductase